MKLLYLLTAMLIAFTMVCIPVVARADSTAPQTPLDQSTQAVKSDPQKEEAENAADGVPEIFVPEKSYQFENVPAGQMVTHDFVVLNKGSALLRITRVKTG